MVSKFLSTEHSGSLVCAPPSRKELKHLLTRDTFDVATLEELLSSLNIDAGPWPVFDLITFFQDLLKALPEQTKDIYRESIHEISTKINATYSSLIELLDSNATTPAIVDPLNTGRAISHGSIYNFVHSFDLKLPTLACGKPRVVVALPCGPTMGLACFAVATYYTMIPMTPNCGAGQFRSDVEQVQATAILISGTDAITHNLKNASWILDGRISVFIVENREDMTFHASLMEHDKDHKAHCPATELIPPEPNHADDVAMVLSTSGTSGMKKLVPITIHTLVAGTAFVVRSWNLTQEDCCLNMMPLHHIGGIVRNLFAPIMSGGSTICCSSFDPSFFWDLIEGDHKPTWYYASPSMHATILAEAENRPIAVQKSRIRLACNAAGGLLPTLAAQLHNTFPKCTVLPSYGMTECMPIATPPLTYCLDRPGTSGLSVGPEISIRDSNDIAVAPGITGDICVRGLPVFCGYLKDDGIDKTSFSEDGWFNTGDMGYLDPEGYLYITGRNKEVINRGGEILSPFEIEEAILSASRDPDSVIYGRVSETLAFSTPHDTLQEVVGVVIVTPPNQPRLGLKQLHEAMKILLHKSKWPVLIVYMKSLPKSRNKVLRIKLSERLDLPSMNDNINAASRYYEAICPPLEEDLGVMIENTRCDIDLSFVASRIRDMLDDNIQVFVRQNKSDGLPQAVLFGNHSSVGIDSSTKTQYAQALEDQLREQIHGYLVPSGVRLIDGNIPLFADGNVDEVTIENLLATQNNIDSISAVQKDVIDIFSSVLSRSSNEIHLETDFFISGGDSLGAGRLLSMLRRHFQLQLPSETLFMNSTVQDVAKIIESALSERQTISEPSGQIEKDETTASGCTEVCSSTNPFVLLLHLLPITVVYPLRLALWWTLFLYGMAETANRFPLDQFLGGRLFHLLLIMTGCNLVVAIIAPVFGIMVKWIVMQRYKAGLYPMWASYHNRWWITQKTLQVCGMGIFEYSVWTRTLYYRLLGAKIGRNVVIHEKAQLGEYDLISIGDNSILDRHCICRPFAAERNASMLLSNISIGSKCTIGLSSIIAPGAVLPANTCIGPNSSSWEIADASEFNRESVTASIAQPHRILQLLIVEPISIIGWLVGRAPWLAGLIGLVQNYPKAIYPDKERSTAMWYTNTRRIGFHYLARVSGASLGPLALFLFILLIKRIMDSRFICGPVQPGLPMANRSQIQRLRMTLLQRLMPEGDLSKLASLLGSHYESVSVLVRALGGRVGKRVYWPGVGPTMQDFELLDVGNDVVFGSRAHLVTSDGVGSDQITLSDGCMVADRAVVQPGTTIGKRTILGSGALTKRNGYYPPDSVWIGSKAGDCISLTHAKSTNPSIRRRRRPNSQGSNTKYPKGSSDENASEDPSTSTPFGRAFYQRKADYHVLGLPAIICYSFLITISVSLYWNTSTVLGIRIVAIVLRAKVRGFDFGMWYRPLSIYALMTASIAVISSLQAILALALIVGTKWLLMGRRSPGSYDWDKSSYCQRWQILLTVERLRRTCFGGEGILSLLTGTHFMVLFFRALGGKIGKDCALFANGKPSLLFTEPDLLTLGDRVAVDDASLVSHINSRGNFKLNELHVGDRSVLRTGSRLLSGASLGEDARLLEHTLIMSGDHINDGDTYQGWPGVLVQER